MDAAAGGSVHAGGQAADLGVGGPGLGGDEAVHFLAQVPGEQQKPPEALRQVDLQHVPEDRTAPDLHQRLGDRPGVFLQAGAAPAAEDDHFGSHVIAPGSHGGGLSGIMLSAMSELTHPEMFKAYDVRGLYGDELDPAAAHAIGRSFARVIGAMTTSRRPSCASGWAATCASPPPRWPGPTARAWWPRAPRCRRRAGRDRDALLPRRLAGPRRRADVHRVAQPQALHGRQAGRAAARWPCRATPGIGEVRDRVFDGLGDAPGGGSVEEVDDLRGVPAGALELIDASAIKPLKVVVDGGNGMAGPMVGPLLERSGSISSRPTGRRTATSPTTSPTRCCPRTASSSCARSWSAERRSGHRLGRRRRPLLLHRRGGARSSTATS